MWVAGFKALLTTSVPMAPAASLLDRHTGDLSDTVQQGQLLLPYIQKGMVLTWLLLAFTWPCNPHLQSSALKQINSLFF